MPGLQRYFPTSALLGKGKGKEKKKEERDASTSAAPGFHPGLPTYSPLRLPTVASLRRAALASFFPKSTATFAFL